MTIKKQKNVKLRSLSVLLLIPIILMVSIKHFTKDNKDTTDITSNNETSPITNSSSENSKSEASIKSENTTPNSNSKNNTINDANNKSNTSNNEKLDPNVPLKTLEIKSYAGEHTSELTKTQVCALYGNTPETMSKKDNLFDNGIYGGCSFNEDGQLINLSLQNPSKLFYNGTCVNGLTIDEIKKIMSSDIDWIRNNSYIKLKSNWYISLQNGKANFAAWCMPGPPNSKKDESDD